MLAAHPDAKNILVVGINDQAVVGALQAATQLGRDGSIMGWGQDGGLITGDNVDPNLVGSVMYFLEGYPAFAFEIADQIAAGNAPAVKDTGDDAAVERHAVPRQRRGGGRDPRHRRSRRRASPTPPRARPSTTCTATPDTPPTVERDTSVRS